MAFDLTDEELKATRIMNGTASKKELYERIAELEAIEKEHKKENGKLMEGIEYWESEKERIGKLYYEAYENCIKYEKIINKEYIHKSRIKGLLKQINSSINHFKATDSNNIVNRIKNRLQELLQEGGVN